MSTKPGAGQSHLIVVNTYRQNHPSRAFSLAHELAHIALRHSGVSDIYSARNEVEIFCNRFAINLLAPRDSFLETAQRAFSDDSSVEAKFEQAKPIARYFRISIAATLIRLEELGLASKGLFAAWQGLFAPGDSPDALKEIRRGGHPDAGKNALAKYGLRFANLVSRAIGAGTLDYYAVFQQTGISEKAAKPMVVATDEQLRSMAAEAEAYE